MDDSHHIVQAALTDREPRVKRGSKLFLIRNEWIVEIEPDDVAARNHKRTDSAIPQFKDAFHNVVFRFFKDPRLSSLFHHHFNFFFGYGWRFRWTKMY